MNLQISGTAGAHIGTPESGWRTRKDVWEYLGYALRERIRDRECPKARTGSSDELAHLLGMLASLEPYWAKPGVSVVDEVAELVSAGRHRDALDQIEAVNKTLRGTPGQPTSPHTEAPHSDAGPAPALRLLPAIEVLVVDDGPAGELDHLRAALAEQRRDTDAFTYEINVVPSAEDAVVALVVNPSIQACVITPRFASRSRRRLSSTLDDFVKSRLGDRFGASSPVGRLLDLERILTGIRPEVDLYLLAGVALESLAVSVTGRFRRIFARTDVIDLHLSLLSGISERYKTPFFAALQEHSRRPGSVFHALPVSRGGSVQGSPWISDMSDFYGINILRAETSATSGGLDSLLDPQSSIKDAQERASRAFGSHRTYFVTNGTSTANKIVHQSILAPGDIVLVDRNCHKSHHYALVLTGASVSYLEAYPLEDHSLYGAVPLEAIKRRLLGLRGAGQLHKVKMIALTNCTFDGVVYDPRRVMEECLAIKPDLVFLWDEAWFAFAGAHPIYRRRTAMQATADLEQAFSDPEYRRRHAEQANALSSASSDEEWVSRRLVADPSMARLRVYATQSTHKTLTSLRQGSMIHVFDQDFGRLNKESFREAFMTHTSTSPNYQILASLDIGRRQVELEGYGLVQKQADLAVTIAQSVGRHPLLRKYFKILGTPDLIPQAYRRSRHNFPAREGLGAWDKAWATDEFVLDPSRITMDISATGVDGDTFKHSYLMDGHGIQVNKTSRNSVLFITNIGTSRSSAAYLIEALIKIAEGFERRESLASGRVSQAVRETAPPLPNFSSFARIFQTAGGGSGDLRKAYYLAGRQDATEYLSPTEIRGRLRTGEVVSAGFVTPYPPGFPVLVPGQIFTTEILDFMDNPGTREVHGLDEGMGYRVFAQSALTA